MNILVVSPIYTNPTIAGSSKCILDYCELLKNMHHNVYFLYVGKKITEPDQKTREQWGDNFYCLYQNRIEYYLSRCIYHFCTKILRYYPLDYYIIFRLHKKIRKIETLLHCDSVITNYPWTSFILKYFKCRIKAIFTHDCFTNKQQRVGFPIYSLSASSEAKALSRSNLILSIQQNESIFFNYLAPNITCKTVFSSVVYHNTLLQNNFNVLYIAANNKLNYQGIYHFLKDIFPPLAKKYPFLHVMIAGNICKSLNDFSGQKWLTLLGRVDNIDEFYNNGDIVINPTEKGTGLKIKTLEAISYGKVVISSPHSTEGLYKSHDLPLLVASSFDDYDKCIQQIISGGINFRIKMKESCKIYIEELNEYITKVYQEITT